MCKSRIVDILAPCSNETRAKDKNNFNQYLDMEKKIRQKIELDAKGKEKLVKAFGVTTQNVRQAQNHRRPIRSIMMSDGD